MKGCGLMVIIILAMMLMLQRGCNNFTNWGIRDRIRGNWEKKRQEKKQERKDKYEEYQHRKEERSERFKQERITPFKRFKDRIRR